jgi:hypothetical protein
MHDLYGSPLRKQDTCYPQRCRNDPRVPDHAIARYIERRLNVLLDQVRQEIRNDRVLAAIEGGTEFVQLGEHWLVLRTI